MLPWGDTWQLLILNITGYPMFDFFFTLVLAFGVFSWMLGMITDLLSKS